MGSKSKPNYEQAVAKARSSRMANIALCGVLIFLAAAGAVLAVLADYAVFGILAAVLVILAAVAVMMKNSYETNAAMAIAKHSIYAVPISAARLKRIRQHQNRRGQSFYLTAMLMVLVPESLILIVIYMVTQNTTYLFFMAGFALLCLLVVLFCMLYLNARFSVKRAVCLVSGRGILIGREVLPFNAKKGEAIVLFRFKDFYCLRFVKSVVFGIKYESEVIFPADGAVRATLEGSCDEELAFALGLEGVFETDEEFYESRDYLSETGVEGYDDIEISDAMEDITLTVEVPTHEEPPKDV